jgi:voltage-gated potassium channel Kch
MEGLKKHGDNRFLFVFHSIPGTNSFRWIPAQGRDFVVFYFDRAKHDHKFWDRFRDLGASHYGFGKRCYS